MAFGDLPQHSQLLDLDGMDVAGLLWMDEWNPVLASPSAELFLFGEDYHGNISINRKFFHSYLRLGWA
jgi:hypothetical protein